MLYQGKADIQRNRAIMPFFQNSSTLTTAIMCRSQVQCSQDDDLCTRLKAVDNTPAGSGGGRCRDACSNWRDQRREDVIRLGDELASAIRSLSGTPHTGSRPDRSTQLAWSSPTIGITSCPVVVLSWPLVPRRGRRLMPSLSVIETEAKTMVADMLSCISSLDHQTCSSRMIPEKFSLPATSSPRGGSSRHWRED